MLHYIYYVNIMKLDNNIIDNLVMQLHRKYK